MRWGYQEDNMAASSYREEYGLSLERLAAQRRAECLQARTDYAKTILCQPEAAREAFIQMLGWPLTTYTPAQPLQVKSSVLVQNAEICIQRLQLELVPDVWFCGLLFLHPDGAARPLVLSQHGGAGTPELCSGLLEMGSVNYNDMTARIFALGANVFAPQLYLWDVALFGARPDQAGRSRDEMRRGLDAELKNLGGSVMAAELFCLRRCIDYLLRQPYVKPGALGMAGLSYGGQYALLLPAVEPRIRASVSSCYFNDRDAIAWSDYVWFDAASRFFDEEIALLVRPRKLFLQVADRDEVFSAEGARRAWQRLTQLSADDLSWVDFRVFEGVHEFDKDDGQLRAMMEALNEA